MSVVKMIKNTIFAGLYVVRFEKLNIVLRMIAPEIAATTA